MHLAAQKGKHLRLQKFLSGNVNAQNEEGLTALCLAAGNGHLHCVNMLLDAKAGVDAPSNCSHALMRASSYNHLDVVNALIDAHADVNLVTKGHTALHSACGDPSGHPIVAALLAVGALVDAPGATSSPLSIAAAGGSVESMKLLISAGADINGSVYQGLPTPLYTSVLAGHTACAKLLLDAKADVNAYGCTSIGKRANPMSGALFIGHREMVKLLISAGADLTIRDYRGATCLHMLAGNCLPDGKWARREATEMDGIVPNDVVNIFKAPSDYPGVFKALVDAKADIAARTHDGLMPLHVAALSKNVEAVNALLAAGADPNDTSDAISSALQVASNAGCLGAVSALIAAGADVNRVGRDGATPLDGAICSDSADMVSALIAAGADVNRFSSNPDDAVPDSTALDIARFRSNDAIIAILQGAGAISWLDMIAKTNELLIDNADTGDIELNTELIDSASHGDREDALKVSVWLGGLTEVKSLLRAGVNPSIQFRKKSVLYSASSDGFTDIVRELIDAGADIAAKDQNGVTALQVASKQKHRDVVALLMAKAKELKSTNK